MNAMKEIKKYLCIWGDGMNAKTVAAEWIHVEDNPPNKKAMCLCEDGKIRFGNP